MVAAVVAVAMGAAVGVVAERDASTPRRKLQRCQALHADVTRMQHHVKPCHIVPGHVTDRGIASGNLFNLDHNIRVSVERDQ